MQENKEKTKERLMLENKKMIFRNIFNIIIGLATCGRKHANKMRKQEKIPVLC